MQRVQLSLKEGEEASKSDASPVTIADYGRTSFSVAVGLIVLLAASVAIASNADMQLISGLNSCSGDRGLELA